MLREVTGGELDCMRRQESVRGLSEASRAGSRVMFSGCWGQRRVTKGFRTMSVPVCWTEMVERSSSAASLVVGRGRVASRRGELRGPPAPLRELRAGESCKSGVLGKFCHHLRIVSRGLVGRSPYRIMLEQLLRAGMISWLGPR